jgi:hypothetical protein
LGHVPTSTDYRAINGQLQEIGHGGKGVVCSVARQDNRIYTEVIATSHSNSDQVALEGLIALQSQWTVALEYLITDQATSKPAVVALLSF